MKDRDFVWGRGRLLARQKYLCAHLFSLVESCADVSHALEVLRALLRWLLSRCVWMETKMRVQMLVLASETC